MATGTIEQPCQSCYNLRIQPVLPHLPWNDAVSCVARVGGCKRVRAVGAGGRKVKGRKPMQSRRQGRAVGSAFAIAAFTLGYLVHLPVQAREIQTSLESAQAYLQKGNLKAAEIELRNAARGAPQDAH